MKPLLVWAIALASLCAEQATAQNGFGAGVGSEPPLTAEMLRSPLIVTGPATVAATAENKNDVLIAMPVRHRLTAVLRNEVAFVDLFATSKLPAGTPLYGVVMSSQYGGFPVTVWCAPRVLAAASVKNLWANGACLAKATNRKAGGYAFLKLTRPSLLARSVAIAPLPNASPSPVIELIDAPPVDGMVLEYRLYGWSKKRLSLTLWLKHDGTEEDIGWLDVERSSDGTARLELLGGTVEFRQRGDEVKPNSRATEARVQSPLSDLDALGDLGRPY